MELITEQCTGCGACVQLCPKHCITMKPDNEGFLVACVDQDVCVDCGLCTKRCPQNRKDLLNHSARQTWAARLKDEQVLYRSASGGAFAGFALHVIRQGGLVFGVRWDDDYNAYHAVAATEDELWPMLSSKYVQSDTRNTYKEVKKALASGKMVLYSGTSCQIAGLKSFLNKPYDNLVTVDLICHGVPSPLLFKKYIELLKNKHGARIDEYDFRDKSGGWGLGYKYRYKNRYKYGMCDIDPYYKYFLRGDTYRKCCYSCKYARTERTGDITIADFWGIEKFHPEFFSTKGVSLILVNSDKGNDFWMQVNNDFYILESKIEYAKRYNKNLSMPTSAKGDREHIYDGIQSMPCDKYFSLRFPLRPSLKDRIKSAMPMRMKLALKKTKWSIQRIFNR